MNGECWTEWVNSDDLRNHHKINYVEDGWYVGCFPDANYPEGWAYVVKSENLFFMTVWENDPRPQFKKMLGAVVR